MSSALGLVKPSCVMPGSIGIELLEKYYQRDDWRLSDRFFKDKQKGKPKSYRRKVSFGIFPINKNIDNEYKFMLSQRIEKRSISLPTVANYGKTYFWLSKYIFTLHPHITSISQLDVNEDLPQYIRFLNDNGFDSNALRISHFKQFYDFICDYYDMRPETERDVWDIRRILGTRFNGSSGRYGLSFEGIPTQYREMVKRYMRLRLVQKSSSSCCADVKALQYFFDFIDRKYKEWKNLNLLTRKEMEDFLLWFRSNVSQRIETGNYYLVLIRIFIEYIGRACWKEAPEQHVSRIMFPEDIPNRMGRRKERNEKIKFIPPNVLAQLKLHLHKLPEQYYPIIQIIIASGWRISDVLNLRYDKCLTQTSQGYYLCGDITKVNISDHKVPITDEIATLVKEAALDAKQKSTLENNPYKYLFTRYRGRRVGLPFHTSYTLKALNRLAVDNNITDDDGGIYHFTNHAFRHTKGVELINSGMPLTHVQKWLAHASMEMTLIYAKVLDSTMRKSWEEATKDGLFRIDETCSLKIVDMQNIEDDDLVEWEYIRHNLDAVRMPLGYCMKPQKQDCRLQLNPCLSCVNLCTTVDFIPQFEAEIEALRIVISKGAEQGRTMWVDKNQVLLDKYNEILSVLRQGRTRHLIGKACREYALGEISS